MKKVGPEFGLGEYKAIEPGWKIPSFSSLPKHSSSTFLPTHYFKSLPRKSSHRPSNSKRPFYQKKVFKPPFLSKKRDERDKQVSAVMAPIGHYRSCRRWRRIKGFRLNSGRLCVYRLRIRFLDFVGLLARWKSVYVRAVESLKKGISCSSRVRRNVRGVAGEGGRYCRQDYKLRTYGRSNSFYAEAIAECLEFIKRSSSATDDEDSELTIR